MVTPFQPLKLLRHADRVEADLRGEPVAPISVEIDLSNTCNHDCPWCSFGTSESHGYRQQHWTQLPTDRVLRLLNELSEAGVKSVTFTGGGEPLVHRAASAIFEAAGGEGLAWGVVTNGWLMRGAVVESLARGATFVRISLDAGSAETHQVTHRVSKPQYHHILAQMAHLREKASAATREAPLTIGAGFCVQSANYREIYQAARDVKEAGGDYLEVRPVFPTEWRGDGFGRSLTDEEVELAQVEIRHAQNHLDGDGFRVIGMVERFEKLLAPGKDYARCHIGPLMTVIGAEGSIWHCCVQRGQEAFRVGSITEGPFLDQWMTERHRRVLADIDVSRCPRCRYDGYNRIIEQAFLRDGMHKDFL